MGRGVTLPRMRPDLEAIAPDRIKRLPVDPDRGYPVPWFVSWTGGSRPETGKPEFRLADARKLARAVREKLCWVCGEVLGRRRVFVIGPMCLINRVSAEPPSHPECATFSVKACPFLARPNMERRRFDVLPDGTPAAFCTMPGGTGLLHNPGLILLYLCIDYARKPDGRGGALFHLGEPLTVEWWTEGRPATPEEARVGFYAGADRLRALALEDGAAGAREFDRQRARAVTLLPKGGDPCST